MWQPAIHALTQKTQETTQELQNLSVHVTEIEQQLEELFQSVKVRAAQEQQLTSECIARERDLIERRFLQGQCILQEKAIQERHQVEEMISQESTRVQKSRDDLLARKQRYQATLDTPYMGMSRIPRISTSPILLFPTKLP